VVVVSALVVVISVLMVVMSAVVLVNSAEALLDSSEELVASAEAVSVSVDDVVGNMKAVVDSVVSDKDVESLDEKEDVGSVDIEVDVERSDDRTADEKDKSVDGVPGEAEDPNDSVIIESEDKEELGDWDGIELVVGKMKAVEYSVVKEDNENEGNDKETSPEVAVVVYSVLSIDCVVSIARDEVPMDSGRLVNADERAVSVGNNS
jgi:hypothetical protein